MSVTKEQINKAAQWWADKIGNVKAKDFDAGQGASPDIMLFGVLAASRYTVTPDQVMAFRKALRDGIKKDANGRLGTYWLGCDYHPCPVLAAAAEKAGISELSFPIKVSMYLERDGTVSVSDGYRAELIKL